MSEQMIKQELSKDDNNSQARDEPIKMIQEMSQGNTQAAESKIELTSEGNPTLRNFSQGLKKTKESRMSNENQNSSSAFQVRRKTLFIEMLCLILWTWFDFKYAFFNPDLNSESPDHCLIFEDNKFCTLLQTPYEHAESGKDATRAVLNIFKFGVLIDVIAWTGSIVALVGQLNKTVATKVKLYNLYVKSSYLTGILRLIWILSAADKRWSNLGQVISGDYLNELDSQVSYMQHTGKFLHKWLSVLIILLSIFVLIACVCAFYYKKVFNVYLKPYFSYIEKDVAQAKNKTDLDTQSQNIVLTRETKSEVCVQLSQKLHDDSTDKQASGDLQQTQPDSEVSTEQIEEDLTKDWKSILQSNLEKYKSNKDQFKAVLEQEEVTRIYKLDLPDDSKLMDSVWHNMIMFVNKDKLKLFAAEFDGIKEVQQQSRYLEDADKVQFVKAVALGLLAVVYTNNKVEIVNMILDTVLHIDYSNIQLLKHKGSKQCKQALTSLQAAANEVHMYMDDNDVDALLVLSVDKNLIQYRLKKLPSGTFEIVELLSEPKPDMDQNEKEEQKVKQHQNEQDQQFFARLSSLTTSEEDIEIQSRNNGIIGFKVHEDDSKDKFAVVNLRERCSSNKARPFMVLNDFRQSGFTWVFPLSFDKQGNPTRAVIVSRLQGIKIELLINQGQEDEEYKYIPSKEVELKIADLEDIKDKQIKKFNRENESTLNKKCTKIATEQPNIIKEKEEKQKQHAKDKKTARQALRSSKLEDKKQLLLEKTNQSLLQNFEKSSLVQKEGKGQKFKNYKVELPNESYQVFPFMELEMVPFVSTQIRDNIRSHQILKIERKFKTLQTFEINIQSKVANTLYDMQVKAQTNIQENLIDVRDKTTFVKIDTEQKEHDAEVVKMLKQDYEQKIKSKAENLEDKFQKQKDEILKAGENEKQLEDSAKRQKLEEFLFKLILSKDMQNSIQDVRLLDNGKLLLVCNNLNKKIGGFYVVDLNQEHEARPRGIELLDSDQLDMFQISKCGRMLAILGPCFLQLWTIPDLNLIARINLDLRGANNKSLRFNKMTMTSDHIFIRPQSVKGWVVVGLKENMLSTTIKGVQLHNIRSHTKTILYAPNESSLGVNVIPLEKHDLLPTLMTCEQGQPLVYKVHNTNIPNKQWVGHWTDPIDGCKHIKREVLSDSDEDAATDEQNMQFKEVLQCIKQPQNQQHDQIQHYDVKIYNFEIEDAQDGQESKVPRSVKGEGKDIFGKFTLSGEIKERKFYLRKEYAQKIVMCKYGCIMKPYEENHPIYGEGEYHCESYYGGCGEKKEGGYHCALCGYQLCNDCGKKKLRPHYMLHHGNYSKGNFKGHTVLQSQIDTIIKEIYTQFHPELDWANSLSAQEFNQHIFKIIKEQEKDTTPYTKPNMRGEFCLRQGNHVRCWSNKKVKIALDEPFFMCECDDHETKILVSKEEGITKDNTLCQHSEHVWKEEVCPKCQNVQPLYDQEKNKIQHLGTGQLSPDVDLSPDGQPLYFSLELDYSALEGGVECSSCGNMNVFFNESTKPNPSYPSASCDDCSQHVTQGYHCKECKSDFCMDCICQIYCAKCKKGYEMVPEGFYRSKTGGYYLCSACKTPRFHGNPDDQFKFYSMSEEDQPEKFKTDSPGDYCTNYIKVGQHYVCMGHDSGNIHGLGKLDEHGYHGSPEHQHMFYKEQTKKEEVDSCISDTEETVVKRTPQQTDFMNSCFFVEKEVITASLFQPTKKWTPFIPSQEMIKKIAIEELQGQDWGLKGFDYFKGGACLGRFTILFGQGKDEVSMRCPPEGSYQDEPITLARVSDPNEVRRIEFGIFEGSEYGGHNMATLRLFDSQDTRTMELKSHAREDKIVELKLLPGEKIIGAKCSHTPNTENFKTILQIEFLVMGTPFKVTQPLHHCRKNSTKLVELMKNMEYNDFPQELKSQKVKIRPKVSFLDNKLIRMNNPYQWSCNKLTKLGFTKCFSCTDLCDQITDSELIKERYQCLDTGIEICGRCIRVDKYLSKKNLDKSGEFFSCLGHLDEVQACPQNHPLHVKEETEFECKKCCHHFYNEKSYSCLKCSWNVCAACNECDQGYQLHFTNVININQSLKKLKCNVCSAQLTAKEGFWQSANHEQSQFFLCNEHSWMQYKSAFKTLPKREEDPRYSALNIVGAKCEKGRPLTYKTHLKFDVKSFSTVQQIDITQAGTEAVLGAYRNTGQFRNEAPVYKNTQNEFHILLNNCPSVWIITDKIDDEQWQNCQYFTHAQENQEQMPPKDCRWYGSYGAHPSPEHKYIEVRETVCQGIGSFCKGNKVISTYQPFWHCECEDHISKVSLCWECAYFGRGKQLGGYEQNNEVTEGLVQINDLENQHFEWQLLTRKEVLHGYIVKDLIIQNSKLTWLVFGPNQNYIIRQIDIKAAKKRQERDRKRSQNPDWVYVLKLRESLADSNNVISIITKRTVKDRSKTQVEYLEKPFKTLSADQEGCQQVLVKTQQNEQLDQAQESFRISVSKNSETVILQKGRQFFHIDFPNRLCTEIPDFEVSADKNRMLKDRRITHNCLLFQHDVQLDTKSVKPDGKDKPSNAQDNSLENIESRFGFSHEQALSVDNQKVDRWWMSPCMKYLIIKVRDLDIFSDDYNYYVKNISSDASKTTNNFMCEIPGMDDLNEFGLVFLSRSYFAIPVLKVQELASNSSDEEESEDQDQKVKKEEQKTQIIGYSIHRLSNAQKTCFLPCQNDFKFIQNSTLDIVEGAQVTGILDVKTGKVYDCNLRSLLHLGAQQLHLTRDGQTLKREYEDYKEQAEKNYKFNQGLQIKALQRVNVLSLHAPGLFFMTVNQLDDVPVAIQDKMIFQQVLKYPVYEVKKGIIFENLFTHLCIKNNSSCLRKWLTDETPVLMNDPTKTCISLMSKNTSEAIIDWLETLDQPNLENLLLGFGLQEVRQVLRMQAETTERFFSLFVYIDQQVFSKINLVQLTDVPQTTVESLSEFRFKDKEKKRVHEAFFKDTFQGKTGGEAYSISVMMVKIQLEQGTMGSRQFLNTLNEEGEINDDIFLYKAVQRLLDYKQTVLKEVMKYYFLQYALYLVSIITFPLIWPEDFIIVMLWMFAQIWLEYIQTTSTGEFNLGEYLSSDIWNLLDVIRILLMFAYVILTILYKIAKPKDDEYDEIEAEKAQNFDSKRAEIFTLLVLFSFIALLQYLRLLRKYRALIKMIIECTKDCIEFIVVLLVLIAGFAFSTFYRQVMNNQETDENKTILYHAYSTFMTALGDFGMQTEDLDSIVLYIIFLLAAFIILIVMMNLLIGIISEKLAEVLEQKEKNDYRELCLLIYDLENIMFWKRNLKEKLSFNRHFMWSQYDQMAEPWKGRVQATTNPIDRTMKAQTKILQNQGSRVESHLDDIDNQLDHVNSDIRTAVVSGQKKMMSEIMGLENKMGQQINNLSLKFKQIEEKISKIGTQVTLENRTNSNLMNTSGLIDTTVDEQPAADANFLSVQPELEVQAEKAKEEEEQLDKEIEQAREFHEEEQRLKYEKMQRRQDRREKKELEKMRLAEIERVEQERQEFMKGDMTNQNVYIKNINFGTQNVDETLYVKDYEEKDAEAGFGVRSQTQLTLSKDYKDENPGDEAVFTLEKQRDNYLIRSVKYDRYLYAGDPCHQDGRFVLLQNTSKDTEDDNSFEFRINSKGDYLTIESVSKDEVLFPCNAQQEEGSKFLLQKKKEELEVETKWQIWPVDQ